MRQQQRSALITRRSFVHAFALAPLAGYLTACGSGAAPAAPGPATSSAASPAPGSAASSSAAAPAAPAGGTHPAVTLNLSEWSDAPSVKYNAQIIQMTEQKYPWIKVAYQPQPSDWTQKITAQMAGGIPPDVIAAYGEWFRTWQEKGQLVVLNDYIKRDLTADDVKDFWPGQWNGMQLNGDQLAIPKYANVVIVFYNKDALDKAGLPEPDPSWDWAKFHDYAAKLTTTEGGKTTQWGFADAFDNDFQRTVAFIWGNCGQVNDPNDIKKFLVDQPPAVEGLSFLQDMIWKDKIAGLAAEMGGLDQGQAFESGKAALEMDGSAQINVYGLNAKFNWNITSAPNGKCGTGSRTAMDGFCIPKGSKHPDDAWDLMLELTSVEGCRLRLTGRNLFPSRQSLGDAYVKSLPDKNAKVVLTEMGKARPDPRSLWYRAAETVAILDPLLQQAFDLNKITVADALKQFVSKVNELYAGTQ